MIKSLEITTRSSCPINCSFCGQDALKAAYKSDMKLFRMEDYALVLSKLPKDCRLDFSGACEPFTHPEAPIMIRLALILGFDVALYSTLMGLKPEGLEILAENPPSLIRIHAPDPNGMKLNEDIWIAAYEAFRAKNLPHTVMAMGPLSPKMFSYAESIGLNVELPEMLSRAGTLWKIKPVTKFKACSMSRWHQNVIYPSGEVVGCCMGAYQMKPILGNLFTQSYQEIYDAAEAWKASDHSNDICSTCEWAIGS